MLCNLIIFKVVVYIEIWSCFQMSQHKYTSDIHLLYVFPLHYTIGIKYAHDIILH